MTSTRQLDKLLAQAEQLKRALFSKTMVNKPCAVISAFFMFTIPFDDKPDFGRFMILYYPDGKKSKCKVFDRLQPLDIKAFTDEHPELEYFIDWERCEEWRFANEPDEEIREHMVKLYPCLSDLTREIIDFLRDQPPKAHYVKMEVKA